MTKFNSRDENEVMASSEYADDAEIQINPRAIWAAFQRNRWIVLAILAAALLLGIASILLSRPQYKATASLQIDQQTAKVLGTEDGEQFQNGGDANLFLQTQLDVLRSRDLAEQVVDKLRLTSDGRFLESAKITAPEGDQKSRAAQRVAVVNALQNAMNVDLPRSSRVARVNVTTTHPGLSAQIANAYADAYINSNLQRRFDQSAYSRRFLLQQLEQTRVKLENSERAMIEFARSAGIIELGSAASGNSAPTPSERSLSTTDLMKLNDSYASAKAARIAAEQQWVQVQSTSAMSLSEVLSNPAMQQLTADLAAARVTYREMRERLKPDHPSVEQKLAAVQALEREQQQLAANIKNSIRDRFQTAQRQERALAGEVDGLKTETLVERDRSIQYNIFKRDVDTNRALYEALLQRFKEISAEAGVTTNNISVVDAAIAPNKPSYPRPIFNLAVAMLLGAIAAGIWVVAREQFAGAIRTPDDVSKRIGLPLLGVTPLVEDGVPVVEALQDPKSPLSEAIHAIRASLEISTTGGAPQSISLTSARSADGKSTLSYALAREFALAGKRTVLIDSDLRAPTVHRLTGLPNKAGLSQVLSGQVSLADVLQKHETSGLSVITSGPLPPDPTLLLDDRSIAKLVTTLRADHDLVIVDGPPILGLADALLIAASVDATILVIGSEETRFANLKAALTRLRTGSINPIGAVLSRFDAKRYGYTEQYGYYYARYGD